MGRLLAQLSCPVLSCLILSRPVPSRPVPSHPVRLPIPIVAIDSQTRRQCVSFKFAAFECKLRTHHRACHRRSVPPTLSDASCLGSGHAPLGLQFWQLLSEMQLSSTRVATVSTTGVRVALSIVPAARLLCVCVCVSPVCRRPVCQAGWETSSSLPACFSCACVALAELA